MAPHQPVLARCDDLEGGVDEPGDAGLRVIVLDRLLRHRLDQPHAGRRPHGIGSYARRHGGIVADDHRLPATGHRRGQERLACGRSSRKQIAERIAGRGRRRDHAVKHDASRRKAVERRSRYPGGAIRSQHPGRQPIDGDDEQPRQLSRCGDVVGVRIRIHTLALSAADVVCTIRVICATFSEAFPSPRDRHAIRVIHAFRASRTIHDHQPARLRHPPVGHHRHAAGDSLHRRQRGRGTVFLLRHEDDPRRVHDAVPPLHCGRPRLHDGTRVAGVDAPLRGQRLLLSDHRRHPG